MRQLLEVLGLAQYAEALISEHGFERVQWMRKSSLADLVDRCGMKVGHASALLQELQKETQANGAIEQADAAERAPDGAKAEGTD